MRVLNSYDLQFTDIIEKKVTELNKRNYQKELDKLIDNIKKKKKCPVFFYTVAVRRAAVTYWNIYLSILKLLYFFTIPTSHQLRNTVNESQKSVV